MFRHLPPTAYPPSERPLMVWDGTCGFCKYWVVRWGRITRKSLQFRPYQEVAPQFPDIELKHFKQASRLIETDGTIYSGPASAFRSLWYANKHRWLIGWYEEKPWFRRLSDGVYQWIATHRGTCFTITKLMFGTNPLKPIPFWAVYLALIVELAIYFA